MKWLEMVNHLVFNVCTFFLYSTVFDRRRYVCSHFWVNLHFSWNSNKWECHWLQCCGNPHLFSYFMNWQGLRIWPEFVESWTSINLIWYSLATSASECQFITFLNCSYSNYLFLESFGRWLNNAKYLTETLFSFVDACKFL